MNFILQKIKAFTTKKQKGVALLLVLSSLMLLSALVVEFAYNSNVTYNIALNERDRLQAYQLALSGLNFSKIVIKYDKEAKKLVQQASQQYGKTFNVQPLYKMMPINSAILRGIAQGGAPSGEGAENPPPAEGEPKPDVAKQTMSTFNMKAAESFLNFEGDFSAEVSAEDSKIPLNSFYALTPTQPDYDRLKNILIYLMRQKPFEPLLKDKIRDSQELATKIVDYIDRNEAINEMGGSERGAENSQYAGSKNKPKNAKLISIEELILVPGMTDDLLSELKKHVTVYKTDTKINACQATPELVRAMIIAYTQNRTDMEPLRIDSEDRIKNAVNAVLGKCPDINAMSQALNESLGVTASSASSAGPTPSSQPATGAGAGSISSSFATMLTADENIYRIESTGTVGNAEVKLIDVLNTGGGNPDNWKDLYWRVE